MILDIDTTKREKIVLGLYEKDKNHLQTFQRENTDNLLLLIEKKLEKKKKSFEDLEAILVNLGPGSFTGTRVGVTVANTLGWSLNIPIFGYKDGNQNKILEKALKNKQKRFFKIALPHYL